MGSSVTGHPPQPDRWLEPGQGTALCVYRGWSLLQYRLTIATRHFVQTTPRSSYHRCPEPDPSVCPSVWPYSRRAGSVPVKCRQLEMREKHAEDFQVLDSQHVQHYQHKNKAMNSGSRCISILGSGRAQIPIRTPGNSPAHR